MSVALITGGSAGLGLELVRALSTDGWRVVTDARSAEGLRRALDGLDVVGVPGDVADPRHRADLAAEVERLGRLDLLVHNASTLGPLPMRTLSEVTTDELDRTWAVNAAGPLALTRLVLPLLRRSGGALVSVTSDAAVEHYGTWGAYAATKAALEHLTVTLGAEEGIAAYAVDPGDMRTQMHQDAFAGEDISDRPLPARVVPHLLALLRTRPAPGRYRAADVRAEEVAR